jgi:hypothetical protein
MQQILTASNPSQGLLAYALQLRRRCQQWMQQLPAACSPLESAPATGSASATELLPISCEVQLTAHV